MLVRSISGTYNYIYAKVKFLYRELLTEQIGYASCHLIGCHGYSNSKWPIQNPSETENDLRKIQRLKCY